MQLLTYGETLLDKTNSVTMCNVWKNVEQTKLLGCDNKLRRDTGKTINIALTYG